MKSLSKEYACALFQVGESQGQTKEIYKQFNVVASIIKNNIKYMEIVCSPDIIKSERVRIIEDTFKGKINLYLLNFLKIIAENRGMFHLQDCLREYTELYNIRYNIIKVKAVTAVIMNEEQKERLRLRLEGLTGKKVFLSNHIDKKCLGGIKIIYNDTLIDLSVKHTLNELKTSFKRAEFNLSESR